MTPRASQFRIQDPEECPVGSLRHSGLAPENLTTLAHLSISAAIWDPNCSGLSTMGMVVNSVSRPFCSSLSNPN
jgi:hypothetical protein